MRATLPGVRAAVPELSADEARRAALDAQGFYEPRRARAPAERDILRVFDRIHLLQLDSINVLERAHYVPLFSRLGPYDRTLLDRLAYEKRELFEFWGHAATLLPVRLHPLLRWRMDRKAWPDLERIRTVRPDAVGAVLRHVTANGPTVVDDLAERGVRGGRGGAWWGWGDEKHVLEWLFATGRVTTATRRHFERVYDLTERVLPAHVLAAPTPPRDDALRELLVASARALGVATAKDLLDYFRLHGPTGRRILEGLADEGGLARVRVEGWTHAADASPDLVVPRRSCAARTLLSPFDPLIFERARTERIFGLRYRIEIYTPEARRVYGYYALPFLLDGDLCARVDLKADRASGRLLVRSAHLEPGRDAARVADALAHEVAEVARWLGLDRVVVERRGGLAASLRRALSPPSRPAVRPTPRRAARRATP